jgi:hypothetical protein
MATNAYVVLKGSTEWGTDGSTWADLPEAKSIAVPDVEIDYKDVTSLDSNGWKEFVAGLKDGGTISIPCNYTSAAYALAEGYRTNGTLIHFQTTLDLQAGQATADIFMFTGRVNPKIATTEVGGTMMMDLEVRTSGAPTFTVATV